jgi:lysozyme
VEQEKLFDELKRDEGERLKPYWDCGHGGAIVCPTCVSTHAERLGLLTIGIGRNLTDVGIRTGESAYLCLNDIEDAEAWLDTKLPWWRKLDEARQRVLMNMCFNLGIKRLLGFKHMLGAAQAAQWDTAVAEMKSSLWFKQVGVRGDRLIDAMATGVM